MRRLCRRPPEPRPSLAEQLGDTGVTHDPISDEPQIVRSPRAIDFDELIEIEPAWQAETAEKMEQTQLARCFMQAIAPASSRPASPSSCVSSGEFGHNVGRPLESPRGLCGAGSSSAALVGRSAQSDSSADDDPDLLLGVIESDPRGKSSATTISKVWNLQNSSVAADLLAGFAPVRKGLLDRWQSRDSSSDHRRRQTLETNRFANL